MVRNFMKILKACASNLTLLSRHIHDAREHSQSQQKHFLRSQFGLLQRYAFIPNSLFYKHLTWHLVVLHFTVYCWPAKARRWEELQELTDTYLGAESPCCIGFVVILAGNIPFIA